MKETIIQFTIKDAKLRIYQINGIKRWRTLVEYSAYPLSSFLSILSSSTVRIRMMIAINPARIAVNLVSNIIETPTHQRRTAA